MIRNLIRRGMTLVETVRERAVDAGVTLLEDIVDAAETHARRDLARDQERHLRLAAEHEATRLGHEAVQLRDRVNKLEEVLRSASRWAEWIRRPGACGEPEWRDEVAGIQATIDAALVRPPFYPFMGGRPVLGGREMEHD